MVQGIGPLSISSVNHVSGCYSLSESHVSIMDDLLIGVIAMIAEVFFEAGIEIVGEGLGA